MYEVNTQYAPAGLGIDLFKMKSPLTQTRTLNPYLASITGGPSQAATTTSNLMLVGAVVGAGLLAYVAAKALKK
jgi:hypothetical protein